MLQPRSDNARLVGARAREHEDWPFQGFHRRALSRIDRRDVRRPGARALRDRQILHAVVQLDSIRKRAILARTENIVPATTACEGGGNLVRRPSVSSRMKLSNL